MHQTQVRPRTEPVEFWKARRKLQQKEVKEYLKGKPVWRSMILLDKRKKPTDRPDLERVKLRGTYVMPLCPFCGLKEKKCTCLDLL